MRIFYALLFFLGPRLAFFLYWFNLSGFVHQVFGTWVWPLLGGIFVPWTTLVYVLAHTSYDQTFAGWDWLWLGMAFVVDTLTAIGAVYYRVKGEHAMRPMQWIKRSRALRILFYLLMYLLMISVSVPAAAFLTAALIGDGAIFPGFWVKLVALIFVVYLVLGFVFGFVNPTMPWLPGLLLNTATILLSLFWEPSLIVFVVLAAGAATLGAYFSGLWLNRSKNTEAPGLQERPVEM